VGDEESRYPVPDPQEPMINVTEEPSDAHKNPQCRNLGKSL
jgi:hypothetical protein